MTPDDDAIVRNMCTLLPHLADPCKHAFSQLIISLQHVLTGNMSTGNVRSDLEQLLRLLPIPAKRNNASPTRCTNSSSAYSSDCSPLSSLAECASLCPLNGSSGLLTTDNQKTTCDDTDNNHLPNLSEGANTSSTSTIPPPAPPPPPPPLQARTEVLPSTVNLLPSTPKPRSRMKTLNWSKISAQRILHSKNNIWSKLLSGTSNTSVEPLDFDTLERLFCQSNGVALPVGSAPNSCPNSPRTGRRLYTNNTNGGLVNALGHALSAYSVGSAWSSSSSATWTGLAAGMNTEPDLVSTSSYASLERRHRAMETSVVQDTCAPMLDRQKSLNVSIFLKQFRSEQQVLNAVRAGAAEELGAERLLHLLRLLPDTAECGMLCAAEEFTRLPPAERFLVKLLAIPSSRLRIECMLLKEEYESNFAHLRPSLDTLIQAGKEIQACRQLHQVLYLILIAGNFLNWGGYAGEAVGFKMLSLLKLSEIRANKPGVSLIHYVASEAKKHNLLPLELSSVEQASKISVDALKSDINSLANKIFKIKHQINEGKWEVHVLQPGLLAQVPSQGPLNEQFFGQMRQFLHQSESQVKQLTRKVETDLEHIRTQLGEFLCEELSDFNLEDCFRIFSCFFGRLRNAHEENERRRENEARQEQRKLSGSKLSLHQLPGCSSDRDCKRNENDPNCSINGSLPRTRKESTTLDGALLQLLNQPDSSTSAENVLFAGGTFRRMGSGRRSVRSSASYAIDTLDARERSPATRPIESTTLKDSRIDNFDRFSRIRRSIRASPLASPTGRNTSLSSRLNDAGSTNSLKVAECNETREGSVSACSSNCASSSNLLQRMAASSHSSLHSVRTVIAANQNASEINTEPSRLTRQGTFVGGSLLLGLRNSLAGLLPKENPNVQKRHTKPNKQVKAKVNSNVNAKECERPVKPRTPIKVDSSLLSQLDGQMRLQLQSLAPATRTTLNRTSLLRMSLNSRLAKTNDENKHLMNTSGTCANRYNSSISNRPKLRSTDCGTRKAIGAR